jgi:hypothetical protein
MISSRTSRSRSGASWLAIPALAALLSTSTGCAFTDITVHPPQPGNVVAPSNIGRGREIVVSAPFVDAREIRERCGMKKNGYNSDTADVHCAVAPNEWVARALADGLASSGFRVLINQEGSSPETPRVQGDVVQFFVEPKIDLFTYVPETDIGVTLHVTSPSGLAADRAFYFKAGEDTFFGTDDTFQQSAEGATKKAVAVMVRTIAELLDRYPRLGALAAPAVVSMRSENERQP